MEALQRADIWFVGVLFVFCLFASYPRSSLFRQALTDPTARRNWEQYGHPDGYVPWTFDLALPAWLRPGKDTGNGTLALYAVGYLVGIFT